MSQPLNLEKTTIVVTGAAGFIASSLITKILEETKTTRVIGIDNFDPYYSVALKKQRIKLHSSNSRFTFHKLSFASSGFKTLLHNIHGQIIFIHAAAKVGFRSGEDDPQDYLKTNVLAVDTLLSYLQSLHSLKHCVFFSSSSIYGDSPNIPFNEECPLSLLSARSLYGITKLSLELLVRRFHLITAIPTTVVRPFNVYGPNGRPDMLPMKIIACATANTTLTVYGTNSTNKRDWTYIDDCVNLLWNIVRQPHSYEVVNIGRGISIGISDVVNIAKKILHRNYNIKLKTKPKQVVPFDGRITLADTTKAVSQYGYSPKFEFAEGFTRICEVFFAKHV